MEVLFLFTKVDLILSDGINAFVNTKKYGFEFMRSVWSNLK